MGHDLARFSRDPAGGGVMISSGASSRSPPRAAKTVVLTMPGEREPVVYLVCLDVFAILGKMLATNQLSNSFGNGPRFECGEVRFLLRLLGAERTIAMQEELKPIDLWISGK